MNTGLATEKMFQLNYTSIYPEYKPEVKYLIEQAYRYTDVDNWVSNNKRRLGKNKLEDFTSNFILDHLYKLDFSLDLGKSKLGIQVTIDDTKVESKLSTLNKLKSSGLYEAIGINQVLLLVIVDNSNGRLWSLEEIEDSVYDSVDKAYESEKIQVFYLTIPE